VLTYLGPLLRCLERYRWWARGLAAAAPGREGRPASWPGRAFSLSFWTEDGLEKEVILHGLRDAVMARKGAVLMDQGWSDWDLEVHGGLWARARVTGCAENHGGARRVLRVRCTLRATVLTRLALLASFGIAAGGAGLGRLSIVLVGIAATVASAAVFSRQALRLAETLRHGLLTVARRARLHYAPPLDADGGGRE